MEKPIHLNEFLRERRESSGRSLEGMATLLKIPVERLTAYELGNKSVPLDELWAICNCLRLKSDDLIELFDCLPLGDLHD